VLVLADQAKPGSQAAEVTKAVRDALAELEAVRLLPPPALDLEAVQLAIDCSDDSAQCLGEVATRMQAEILILPRLEAGKDSLELRITRFEKATGEAPVVAMRKQSGSRLDATLLDAVPSMLRELLQIEDEPQDAAPDELLSAPADEDAATRVDNSVEERSTLFGLPLGPVLVGGGGLVLLTAGVVVGAVANATENEWAEREIDTQAQAKAASILRQNGKDQATAANVLMAVGIGGLVAATVWYVLDPSTESAPEHARLQPMLGPSSAGLVLSGAWGAGR
jgi:hypothetical protein